METILVTGGAGFIGSNLVRHLIDNTDKIVINVDALTYAGNLESLNAVSENPRYHFEQVDIKDSAALKALFEKYQPDAVMHLAAESHVDRSIEGPSEFIQTNIIGTYNLLETSLAYWSKLNEHKKRCFRFLHVSTDEVYGSLGTEGYFTETTAFEPNSPYSASKASSDHLVRAWHHTYGLPVLTSNCSNNYGPYQFPEKLMPLVILNALEGKPLPIYGKGDNIRDWLYVQDHVEALIAVLEKGKVGETYNIGGNNEKTNLEVVNHVCKLLDELLPESKYAPHASLITYVEDRPGHDKRYAIDATKTKNELNWEPKETFETGLRKTIQWYLDNMTWSQNVLDGNYRRERLGLSNRK